MNKILYFLVSTLLVGQFFGQHLFNFENSNWYIVKTNWDTEEISAASQEVFQTSSMIGVIDTTLHYYYKVNTTLPFNLNGKDQKQFFVRQDSATGKVFIRSFMDESLESLLYDFNLKEGDTINSALTTQLKGSLVVTKVIQAGTENEPIRMIEAKLDGEGKTFKFTEGVGSMYGFVVNLSMDVMNGTMLKCYHMGNSLILSQGGECPETPKLKLRPTRKTTE